ncbi:hypothetical protein ABZ905_08975 [Streptomyces parvus]|uniref:hypothetical protein n=1 Tax=Streptomyces parvus TaxID=66428 RepID=UPI0033E31BA8
MSASTPPRTPTVAIARVLRSLGLTQGADFRVTGDYRNGERTGTYVLVLSGKARDLIAAQADEIERLSAETPYPFRVSLRYLGGPRPMPSVANYGSRVRDTPPTPEPAPEIEVEAAPEAAPQPAPEPAPEPALTPVAAAAATPEAEPTPPPAGTPAGRRFQAARERAWTNQQARALNWSTRQADLVTAAAAGQLVYDSDGTLVHRPAPAFNGRTVRKGRINPLLNAGLLVVTGPEADGRRRVRTTYDGREALLIWRLCRPTPAEKDQAQEREPLRPLLGGQESTRRSRAFAEEMRRAEAERAALYAAFDELHAWEEREERLRGAWATVNRILNPTSKRPTGWVPTDAEIAEHRIAPDIVTELRADAGHPIPKPDIPATRTAPPQALPPLPAAPLDVEQLDLFASA